MRENLEWFIKNLKTKLTEYGVKSNITYSNKPIEAIGKNNVYIQIMPLSSGQVHETVRKDKTINVTYRGRFNMTFYFSHDNDLMEKKIRNATIDGLGRIKDNPHFYALDGTFQMGLATWVNNVIRMSKVITCEWVETIAKEDDVEAKEIDFKAITPMAEGANFKG